MSHALAIDLGHDQAPLPNQPFSSWLRGQTTLFISQIVAILGIISFLASMIYYVLHLGDKGKFLRPEYLRLVIDYAHIVFIAMFILVLFKILDDNARGSYRVRLVYERVFGKHEGEPDSELEMSKEQLERLEGDLGTSKEQLKDFKRRFLWFWIGMLVLYVVFACQHSYELAQSKPGEASAHHISSSVSSDRKGHDGSEESFEFKFELSHHVAGGPHKPAPETAGHGGHDLQLLDSGRGHGPANSTPHASPRLSWQEAAEQLAFPYLAFLFNNLTLWAIYLCFLVMHLPRDETGERYRRHRRRTFAALVGLSLPLPALVYFMSGRLTAEQWTAYSSIFDALSGVLNALVLALLIARLDSKLVGLPSWLISILYSYAAVQPLFLVFELKQSAVLKAVAVFVLFFVFISKIYFFLIIIYALQTGKMLNYLFCVTALREKAGAPAKGHGRSRLLKAGKVLGLFAAVYFFLSLTVPAMLPGGWGEPDFLNKWLLRLLRPEDWAIDLAQIGFVSFMIASLSRMLERNDYDESAVAGMARRIFGEVPEHARSTEKGKEQLKKFKRYFLSFLWATLGLYCVLLLDHLEVRFSGAYLPDSLARMGSVLPYSFLEFSLATLNLMFIFWCFVILQSPAFDDRAAVRQRLMFNYSRFVILLLIPVYPLLLFLIGGPKLSEAELRGYATVFNGVAGTLSAVALALLIARMDSTLFGLPRWTILALFAYAAIQPLFIAFALNEEVLKMVETSTLVAALLLKVCFFLIVAHSLRSGKVINYLVCFPFLRDRVDSIFENQFEIALARAEHNSYTISILKKNRPYYSTAKKFESREACDKFADLLRARMGDKAAYWPPKQAKGAYRVRQASGTYWVEVRSFLDHLACESIPLRSKEEADEMISESREKIPYCKYNRA